MSTIRKSQSYKAGSNLTKYLKENRNNLGLCATIFLGLGCVPAYFDFMVYAISMWLIGCALINVFAFDISYRKT